ncbi:MAG TPA: hypothetical protein VK088_11260 [Acidimicrobiia bacterium]|nr:hypothetical protein [Acidimicrobiia bacterium]
MNESGIEITGGAGPFEAAAVVAAVHHVVESERLMAERRGARNRPSAWMASVRQRQPEEFPSLLPPDHRGDPI